MFHINFDASDLLGLKDIEESFEQVIKDAEQQLAAMTHAKAVELANERLNSRRQMFVDALSLRQEDGLWVVNLEGSARWIDEGQQPHEMLPDLLKSSKAKRAEDGSLYVVVPFQHGPGKGKTNTPASSMPMVDTLKSEFKSRKIPWSKIERDSQGRPKIGRLHKFNVDKRPTKTGTGPGQGHGPKGEVRQGPTGIPFLHGVAVYQHEKEGGGTQRSIMTFRTASSKHQGRWQHPGIEATNIMEDAWKWAQETMENEIAPTILENLNKVL